MDIRMRNGLAIAALIALAACQGGGGSSSLPTTTGSPLDTGAALVQPDAIARTAPAGVRTYVHLPLRNGTELDTLIQQQSSKDSPMYHHWLTPAQFRAAYGPRADDLKSAAATMQSLGFKTTITSQGIIADAPRATVERTFGVRLGAHVQSLNRLNVSTLAADRAPTLPAALSKMNANVAAFASLTMRPQSMRVSATPIDPTNRYGQGHEFYWFDDLKEAYEYPAYGVANGTGKTIAIVGAADFLDSDVALYFGHEHLTPPTIVRRPVDGGPAAFDPNNGLSDEASLDVQQAGGSAPGATLMFYGAPDASITPSFLDMYTAIVEDNKADVVNTSFGLCELYFTAAYNGGQDFTQLFNTFHDVFRQGNAQGITFVQSSGDNGALGCTDPSGSTATYGVEWSADDTAVTAVGGTNLVTSNIPHSLQSTYVSENAYSDQFAPGPGVPAGLIWGSGGGKSVIFPKPPYQYFVNTRASKRAVPDVSLMMGGCPYGAVTPCGADRSAFVTALAGGLYLFIGTSGAAPEFAGLQAVQDQVLGGRAGNVNYLIYGLAALGTDGNGPIFHNDIPGNNGYPSHLGYNYVVGNGTVRGSEYALQPFGPFAGDPRTATNP